MVMIVKPIIREYPKCREGMAAEKKLAGKGTSGRRRLTVLVTESVFCPNAPCTIGSMHRVYKAIAASEFPIWPFDALVAQ